MLVPPTASSIFPSSGPMERYLRASRSTMASLDVSRNSTHSAKSMVSSPAGGSTSAVVDAISATTPATMPLFLRTRPTSAANSLIARSQFCTNSRMPSDIQFRTLNPGLSERFNSATFSDKSSRSTSVKPSVAAA